MDQQLANSAVNDMETISTSIATEETTAGIPNGEEKKFSADEIDAAVQAIKQMTSVLGFMNKTIVGPVADAKMCLKHENDEKDKKNAAKKEKSDISANKITEDNVELIAKQNKLCDLGNQMPNQPVECAPLKASPVCDNMECLDGEDAGDEGSDGSYSSFDSSDISSDEYVL